MKSVKYLFFILFLSSFFACVDDDSIIDETPAILNTTPNNWMAQILRFYSEDTITLTDICFPRAHDAGNYFESFCTVGASACNTRTQEIPIAAMLEAGIREFDMRPILAADSVYYTHHYTGCGGLGCNGDSFENMLLAIKTFLDSHAELIIVDVNHFCETNNADETLVTLINNTLGNRLFTQTTEDTTPFLNLDLKDVVSLENNTGKAIVTYEGLQETAETRAFGQFSESGSFVTEGSYSNKFVVEEMKADQLAKFEHYEPSENSLFEISWTLTQNTQMAIDCALGDSTNSIFNLATLANNELANSVEAFVADSTFQKGKIPNVISIDRANTFVTDACIEITKLNLE